MYVDRAGPFGGAFTYVDSLPGRALLVPPSFLSARVILVKIKIKYRPFRPFWLVTKITSHHQNSRNLTKRDTCHDLSNFITGRRSRVETEVSNISSTCHLRSLHHVDGLNILCNSSAIRAEAGNRKQEDEDKFT